MKERGENTTKRWEIKERPEKMIREAGEHTDEGKSVLGVDRLFSCDEFAEAKEDSVTEWFSE